MDLKSKIILISGPTASGKSKFAIQLAKKINGEVINADSMQIFKELKRYNISLICLAGYMKIISKNFLKLFRKKIVNIHPSLLPKFKGLNTFSFSLSGIPIPLS